MSMHFRRGFLDPQYQKDALDAAASTTTAATYFWRAPVAGEVQAVHMVPGAAVTANDTNFGTVICNKGASTIIASKSTKTTAGGGSGDWVAGTPVPLALSATLANRELAAGDVLSFQITKDGSGVQIPASAMVVTFRPRKRR